MGNKLSKSEFMALATNHYYNRKYNERTLGKEGFFYTISRVSKEKDKKDKKRGF